MPRRLRPLRRRVELLHDGDLIEAEAGEPLALSLLASGRSALSRSAKWHRARGPYCLRAACEGCLVRVDGVPNVFACQHAVTGGETVTTQNVLGTRELDLLHATDFLFPNGLDHHRLFAGVTGVSPVVQRLARRIAGLGQLPDSAQETHALANESVPVLIVGGGGAGLALAAAFGGRALLVEDSAELGGAQRLLAPTAAAHAIAAATRAGARLATRTTAAAIYPRLEGGAPSALLVDGEGARLVRAERIVIASGTHEATPLFPGGDLPGIYSARAGLLLLAAGVLPGERVAVIGEGEFAEAAQAALARQCVLRIHDVAQVEAAEGSNAVSRLRLSAPHSARRVGVDAVLYDAPGAPAFELCTQAGGQTRFDPALGYVPITDADGLVAPRTYCFGRVAGSSLYDAGRFVARFNAR